MGTLKYLLDTCSFVWLCAEPSRLSSAATTAIGADDAELLLSDASALEISLKWSAHKLQLPSPPRRWVESQVTAWALATVSITREDMYRASELPEHHRDPFDRLLVAAALNHGATIVTPDTAIHKYPVASLW